MYQAVILTVGQLIPEHLTGNNSPALVVVLLMETEITFVHIIHANIYLI